MSEEGNQRTPTSPPRQPSWRERFAAGAAKRKQKLAEGATKRKQGHAITMHTIVMQDPRRHWLVEQFLFRRSWVANMILGRKPKDRQTYVWYRSIGTWASITLVPFLLMAAVPPLRGMLPYFAMVFAAVITLMAVAAWRKRRRNPAASNTNTPETPSGASQPVSTESTDTPERRWNMTTWTQTVWNRKSVRWSAVIAAILIALVTAGFVGRNLAPTETVTAASSTSSETAETSTEEATPTTDEASEFEAAVEAAAEARTADLQSANDALRAELAHFQSPPDTSDEDAYIASLSDEQRYAYTVMLRSAEAAGQTISIQDLRFEGVGGGIDCALARQVEVGNQAFGSPICAAQDVVTASSKDDAFGAALRGYLGNAGLTGEVTVIQSMVPLTSVGNTQLSNSKIVPAPEVSDPAGTVYVFVTDAEALKDFRANPEGFDWKKAKVLRGACVNPQFGVPVPTGNGSPVSPRPIVPQGGGNIPPVTPVFVCKNNPDTWWDDCAPGPHNPCDEDNPSRPESCNPTPPPSTTTPPVVTTTTEPPCDNPETPEDECNPTTTVTPPPSETTTTSAPPVTTTTTQPPVVTTTPKCNLQTGEHCGTPDNGGEQQPVQDNDPELVDPTEGYTPGDAETVIIDQPVCTGDCGTDTITDGGTIIDDSMAGGQGPGGHAEAPGDGDNADSDGSSGSTNPDNGTSNHEDSPVGDETVTAVPSAPLFNLPSPDTGMSTSENSGAAHTAPLAAEPAVAEPAPAQAEASPAHVVNDEPSRVPSFTEQMQQQTAPAQSGATQSVSGNTSSPGVASFAEQTATQQAAPAASSHVGSSTGANSYGTDSSTSTSGSLSSVTSFNTSSVDSAASAASAYDLAG